MDVGGQPEEGTGNLSPDAKKQEAAGHLLVLGNGCGP